MKFVGTDAGDQFLHMYLSFKFINDLYPLELVNKSINER